jgi:hypothetical protein
VPGAPGIPREVPLLGQKSERELLLRIGCDGFNGRPPLAELLRPENRTLLPDAEWPRDPSNQGPPTQVQAFRSSAQESVVSVSSTFLRPRTAFAHLGHLRENGT